MSGRRAGGRSDTVLLMVDRHPSTDRAHAAASAMPGGVDYRASASATEAFEALPDTTRSCIEASVQALMRPYRSAQVARSAGSDEITADRVLDEGATLYLLGDATAPKLLRPLLIALLSEVVERAYERASKAGGKLEPPLLLCLDELGSVAPLPNLVEIASAAPAHNIQLVSIFRDLAEAGACYPQLYGRPAPTRMRLRLWFEDRRLRRLADAR